MLLKRDSHCSETPFHPNYCMELYFRKYETKLNPFQYFCYSRSQNIFSVTNAYWLTVSKNSSMIEDFDLWRYLDMKWIHIALTCWEGGDHASSSPG